MTIDKALETLFAMANVQDGYAKKATDPGLKIIHKANARAQREVAAAITDLRAERDAALARVGDSLHWQSLHGWEPDEGTWAILWPGYYGPFTACWINGRWTMCEDHDFSHATVGAAMYRPAQLPPGLISPRPGAFPTP